MNIVPTKLRYFYDKGVPIRGVVHVGMSWGEEIADYLAMGAEHVIGFEPIPEAFAEAEKLYGQDYRVDLCNFALGDKSELAEMTVVKDTQPMAGHPVATGGSSFLKELSQPSGTPDRIVYEKQTFRIFRFDSLYDNHTQQCNCLVIDAQGMELNVLKGMGKELDTFECANIECSRVPVYEGEASAEEVIAYMKEHGFTQMTPIEDHDDILFQRL